MSNQSGESTIWRRITSIPDSVPDDMARYYIYWKIFYVLAGLGHGFALIMFVLNGVTVMAVFNIFSVSLFATAYFLLRAGYYRTAYWGAITELTLHGIAATICVGTQFGFSNYTFLVVILAFIQPFYSWRKSALIAAVALASAVVVTYYAMNHEPIYRIPQQYLTSTTLSQVVTWPLFVLIMVLPFIRASARAERELAAAFAESERLLLNILPESIAKRLKTTAGMIADDRDRVAILFADIVGFTNMSGRLQPAELVALLNQVFNAIDELVAAYGVEKIKTIGDAYMVVAGLPDPIEYPEEKLARLALDMQDAVSQFRWPGTGQPLRVRIGLNAGKVVAGVIGNRKFAYDLWGDAVNVAARMEATGEPGRIQVTDDFRAALEDRFVFEPRGEIDIKGKGKVATSFLVAERAG
ncbi:adenylate/guanylate cyclase domain-containing protein [Hoeflea sp.]|uniref:adenylate/guanylate cyclase domain-containing protein n=1 Tax=Hoeflea sp. TaxID=1940281 RepID=UPI003B02B45C